MKIIIRDFKINKFLYMMAVPVLLFYVIFHYIPMYGVIIAFKQYTPIKGIMDSPWVGFKYFNEFFNSYYFWRLIKNTLLISLYELLFAFPAPIIFALLLNEIRQQLFKRIVQTITYLPHFISTVVICGMIIDFVSRDGIITDFLVYFGMDRTALLGHPENFRTIYITSGIWQNVGWGTIIYLAALSGINQELYEAAKVDGAGKFRQMRSVSIPGIMPVIVILLILQLGSMLTVGFEKIILLYNPSTYDTADVLATFIFRRGLADGFEYSYTSAVGLFQSVVNFILLISANQISRKVSETSLW